MFVQVIQGPVSDAGQARAQMDRWMTDLAPGAEGWLGSTGGVTDDGTLIALVRFESEEAAMRNSDRPEQGEWWSGMEALFTGEPKFRNSSEVDVDTPGDPAAARFVQVMQGTSTDPDRVRELMAQDPTDWASFRPDILGSVSAAHEGGDWTMCLYFTSEEAAREGEQKEPPPELQAILKEMDSLSVGETRYYDLREPWLDAPR